MDDDDLDFERRRAAAAEAGELFRQQRVAREQYRAKLAAQNREDTLAALAKSLDPAQLIELWAADPQAVARLMTNPDLITVCDRLDQSAGGKLLALLREHTDRLAADSDSKG